MVNFKSGLWHIKIEECDHFTMWYVDNETLKDGSEHGGFYMSSDEHTIEWGELEVYKDPDERQLTDWPLTSWV